MSKYEFARRNPHQESRVCSMALISLYWELSGKCTKVSMIQTDIIIIICILIIFISSCNHGCNDSARKYLFAHLMLLIFPSDNTTDYWICVTATTKTWFEKQIVTFLSEGNFTFTLLSQKKRILRCPEIMKRNRHCFDKNKTPVSRPSISRHSSYCSRIPASWVESWLSIHHHHQGPQDILVENLECAAPLVVAVLWSKYVYVSTYLMGHNVIHENNQEASFSFDLCSIEIWWYDFDRCQLIGWMAI